MKKPFFVFLFACTLLSSSFAQDDKTSDVALYHFMIHLDDEYQSDFLTFEDFVDAGEDMAEGKPYYLDYILEPYYAELQESLEENTALSFLDPAHLIDGKGRPAYTKNRAMKAISADYYARIDLFIRPAFGSSTTEVNLGLFQSEKKKIRPQIVVKLVMFDKQGNKIANFKSKAKSKKQVILTKKVFANWFRINEGKDLDDYHNLNVLDKVVYAAIDDLIEQVKGLEG